MDLLYIAHAVSVVLGLAGACLVAFGMVRAGQALWVPANVLWVIWCGSGGDWCGLVLFAVYLALSAIGVVRSAPAKPRVSGLGLRAFPGRNRIEW